VPLAGLTKPGEVGEILALYSLKSLSLDYKREIKVALFLFAGHSFLVNNLRFMVKLIVKAIVINGKIHNNKRKRFYSSNKEGLIC
jgi:tRNA U38,U39,U40 pseudouridine synthase TruA